MRNYYAPGSWNAICDRCGFKHKSHDLRKEWTGLMVCDVCFETRHPQTLIRTISEDPSTPWTRPETVIYAMVPEYITTEDLVPITPETGLDVGLQTES